MKDGFKTIRQISKLIKTTKCPSCGKCSLEYKEQGVITKKSCATYINRYFECNECFKKFSFTARFKEENSDIIDLKLKPMI